MLRGQFRVGGNQGDGVALRHFREQMQEEAERRCRDCDCFGFLPIIDHLDADTAFASKFLGCQLAARLAGQNSIGLAWRNCFKVTGNRDGHPNLLVYQIQFQSTTNSKYSQQSNYSKRTGKQRSVLSTSACRITIDRNDTIHPRRLLLRSLTLKNRNSAAAGAATY